MKNIQKPERGEYAPYAIMYIKLVPDDGLVLQHLLDNLQMVKDLVGSQPEEKLISRCAEGEWTIKEILGHIVDTERIFASCALRFARNDATDLPGFDQDDYVAYSGANERRIEDILEELTVVRMATITLFKSFDEEVLKKSGLENGHNLSVRSAVYQIAGHELHHINSIRENYFSEGKEEEYNAPQKLSQEDKWSKLEYHSRKGAACYDTTATQLQRRFQSTGGCGGAPRTENDQ